MDADTAAQSGFRGLRGGGRGGTAADRGVGAAPRLFAGGAAAVIEKPTFGATALPAALADYDAIEFVGLCTDICVISNALLVKAFYPEKRISVDAACCAGVTSESHTTALNAMRACQIEVRG